MAEMKQFGIDLELDDAVAQGIHHRLCDGPSRRAESARQKPHHPHSGARQTPAAFVAGEYRALREQRGQDRDPDPFAHARGGAQDGAGIERKSPERFEGSGVYKTML